MDHTMFFFIITLGYYTWHEHDSWGDPWWWLRAEKKFWQQLKGWKDAMTFLIAMEKSREEEKWEEFIDDSETIDC